MRDMFVIITVDSGILEDVHILQTRRDALSYGQTRWQVFGRGEGEMRDDPGFDTRWGGITRGYVMHWFSDDTDVWIEKVS